MNPQALSTCFCTPDVDACRAFYRKHFAASIAFDCGWYLSLRFGSDGPTVQFMEPRDDRPVFGGAGVVLNFMVEDVDAEHARLTGEGLAVLSPLEDHPWGDRGFSVADPIGNVLYLYKEIEPTEEYKAYYRE